MGWAQFCVVLALQTAAEDGNGDVNWPPVSDGVIPGVMPPEVGSTQHLRFNQNAAPDAVPPSNLMATATTNEQTDEISEPAPEAKADATAAGEDEEPKDLAIFTVALGQDKSMCGMVKWCQQAQKLQTIIPRSDIVIVTDRQKLDDCPNARIIAPDTNLQSLVHNYVDRHPSLPDGGRFGERCMGKLQALSLRQYKAVFVVDWDVDMLPPKQQQAAIKAWSTYFPEFLDSPYNLLASPDHEAPVNAGVWLAKPASPAWDLLMNFLAHTPRWSKENGFNAAGPPKDLKPSPEFLSPAVNRTQMMVRNSWKFVGGGTDQGMLFWLFHVQLNGTYLPTSHNEYRVNHWWAAGKPWEKKIDAGDFVSQWAYFEDLQLPNPAGPDTACTRELEEKQRAQQDKEGQRSGLRRAHQQMVFLPDTTSPHTPT